MKWENKVKMSELADKRKDSAEDNNKFYNYILKHIDNFDNQTWHIFTELIEIIPETFTKNYDFWKIIYPKIKEIGNKSDEFDMRAMLRLSLIESMCEEELNLEYKNE